MRERRDGVDDPEELTLADDQHYAFGFGDDRSGAGTVIEEREFADNGSGSESCNFLAVALHGGGSADDDESFAAGLTLINDQCTSGETHLIGGFGDLFEVLVGARLEERDLTEALEVRLFRCHEIHYTTLVNMCEPLGDVPVVTTLSRRAPP